ncbi:MAG: HlyC/CorC family transporter [Litorivicinaceae bacterium]|nr:HlyC/CorC family transporter [Litorivicinaceae bacterium]MDP5342562.1 HlyC/CorC family transporter [Litorivicinaceae bacterium]
MSEIPNEWLFGSLIFLIALSAFFSSSETGLMAINRIRLQHEAESGSPQAKRILALLDRPDRLIGLILIGNNFVNILASAIATILAVRLFGDAGVAIATGVLTLVILIFAEVTPKTFAALHPERVARPVSFILGPLMWLFYPLVWMTNLLSNGLLRLFGIDPENSAHHRLTKEELRTLMLQSGHRIPARRHSMLLSVLDLEKVQVDEIMVPRGEITGLDLDDDPEDLLDQLRTSQHTRLPVFRGDIEHIVGILHLRTALKLLDTVDPTTREEQLIERITLLVDEPYFIPLSTPLHTQLFNFQKSKERMAMVVDEYGEIQGLLTIDDILEEIVGEFTTDHIQETSPDVHPQDDGTWIVDGSATLRDLNKTLEWTLLTDGPRTLSGLIIEQLEFIPDQSLCVAIGTYRMEILAMQDNRVRSVRVWQVDS